MVDALAIINTLQSEVIYLRTLDHIWVDKETISVGNNAVAARCRVYGWDGTYLIKCYYRHKKNLAIIYGSAYMPRELGIYRIFGEIEYIDIVLRPWVDGTPLDKYIGSPDTDYKALSREFDLLAYRTLGSVGAHGDVKPENIIVKPDGGMTLIDWDGAWLPELNDVTCEELGTPAYRHPRRTTYYYARFIDDFPIALISTALAALAADYQSMHSYIQPDKSLFDPHRVVEGRDNAMRCAISLFRDRCDAVHYRIATSTQTNYLCIHGLRDMLAYANITLPRAIPSGAELWYNDNFCGYIKDGKWIVPPLFDNGFEVHNGVYELYLGDRQILIPVM